MDFWTFFWRIFVVCIDLVYQITATQELEGRSLVDGKMCPPQKSDWIRIGETRFYILQSAERQKHMVDWNEAGKLCKTVGMKLAKIDKLTTLSVVGRALEIIINREQLMDSWYWLDAKFEDKRENYFWTEDKSQLKYSHFFYRQPRPTGVGSFMTFDGSYDISQNIPHCLTLALPWPGAWEQGNTIIYGHETSFDEKPCVGTTSRHAMCESTIKDCKLKTVNPFELTEDKDSYFYNGNWIFGKRKYIVNWKPRSSNESDAYCKSLGLQLYTPSPGGEDKCLIPFLKMWSRNVTLSHFWTNWKYDQATEHFLDANGGKVGETAVRMDTDRQARSTKNDPSFCVSATMRYEFKDQLPCVTPGECNGNWDFMTFDPANCKNYLGTICQHSDYDGRKCTFPNSFITNVTNALILTAVEPFGNPDNRDVYRSRYKQTFGSLVCPIGFRMLRRNNTSWHKGSGPFKYDYEETYWLVDDELFNKHASSKCLISEPGKRNKPTSVPCTDWHFYLCERMVRTPKDFKGNAPGPHMEAVWNQYRHARHYPILE